MYRDTLQISARFSMLKIIYNIYRNIYQESYKRHQVLISRNRVYVMTAAVMCLIVSSLFVNFSFICSFHLLKRNSLHSHVYKSFIYLYERYTFLTYFPLIVVIISAFLDLQKIIASQWLIFV